MMRISAGFSIQSQASWEAEVPEFAMITLALAFHEVKARLLQIADEFSDFAGHD